MSNLDVLSMCLRNLLKRKLRTSLTILGVMVGTAAIVVMISLGMAVNQRFSDRLETMGDLTLITLYDNSRWMRDDGQNPAPKLDDYAISLFERIPHVEVATPIFQGNLYFKSGKYTMNAWCMGLKPEAMPLLGYIPETGRLLQDGDKYEVVFGPYAEAYFQQPGRWEDRAYQKYLGQEVPTYVDIFKDAIKMSPDSRYLWNQEQSEQEYDFDDENAPRPIRPYEINVVGLLAQDENEHDWNKMFGIFFDIDVLKELVAAGEKAQQKNQQEWGDYSAVRGGNNTNYDQAYVKVSDFKHTKKVYEEIKEMGYEGWYPARELANEQETIQTVQILLFAMGAVALFVAAIGIANTMIMAIYERTREIGVMKVIGAAIRDIKRLFLLEAAMIGFFGGMLGVGLSLLASYLLNNADVSFFMETPYYYGQEATEPGKVSLITPLLCLGALGFASLIGLVSGYFPARRAMRLSALSAIRTE